MVGSITFLKKEGDYVHKGDEVCFILVASCDTILLICCLCWFVRLSDSSSSLSLGISPLEGAR